MNSSAASESLPQFPAAATAGRTTVALQPLLVVSAALLALLLKISLAYFTFGTNDVVTFYQFARSLNDHGLEWTYAHNIAFNHPPLTAYYLRWIYQLDHLAAFRDQGIAFPLLLRLPGILADFVVVLALLRAGRINPRLRLPLWALLLFALSPVSLMVSGFHGNTDSVMVMFLTLAALMCVEEKPLFAGVFFALACQTKIIPLLFFPILLLFWWNRRALIAFVLPFGALSLLLWLEPLLNFPLLFLKNVLSYGSFWGLWGITYWLRLTDLPAFSMVTFFNLPPAEQLVVTVLKFLIIGSVLLLAWRRRQLDGVALLDTIAYAWIIFFVFSPGVCAQYMVWLAPFVLLLWPRFYAWLTAASALFLFFFYNIIAGGLPWYLAISTNKLNTVWTPWSLWPWAVLIAGLFLCWRRAREQNPKLRLLTLEPVRNSGA